MEDIFPVTFATPIPGWITLSNMEEETARMVSEEDSEPDSGWDSQEQVWIARAPDRTTARGLFPARGTQVDGESLWVTGRRIRRLGADFYEGRITCLGLLSERGYKATIGAGSQTQSVENFTFLDGEVLATYAKAQVTEADPTVALQYLVVGEKPDTSTTGTAQDPPEAYRPTVRESMWTSLASPTLHYPYGWVLLSREVEGLSGVTGVWLVTDRYKYQHRLTP